MKTTIILAALAVATIVATGYIISCSKPRQKDEENTALIIINNTNHELAIFADKMEIDVPSEQPDRRESDNTDSKSINSMKIAENPRSEIRTEHGRTTEPEPQNATESGVSVATVSENFANNNIQVENSWLLINQQKDIIIPNDVTFIKDNEYFSSQITSVIIPNSVTAIGKEAFANNRIRSIIIPYSVTSIGAGAFKNNQLTGVALPDNINTIAVSTFENNQLTNIIIPRSVTSIGAGAFKNNLLNSVIIPDRVTFIGDGAFDSNQINTITIGTNVAINNAFPGNFSNAYISYNKSAGTYVRYNSLTDVWVKQ